MGRLQSKVAIITGAASGFGEGMAYRFAEEGARIVVADINTRRGERVAKKIGDAAVSVQTDVSQASEFDELLHVTMEAFGRVDIMVNNAGFTHRNGDMLGVDEHDFDMITAVNMKAIYHAARKIVPIMEKQGGGVILTTSSMDGIRPRAGLTWYNASKGWEITATRSMALELAPKNIRVNCICPAAGETGMLTQLMGGDTPEVREKFLAAVPLGRFSTPLDVANAALWLVSDEAAMVTGVALEVDGGSSI